MDAGVGIGNGLSVGGTAVPDLLLHGRARFPQRDCLVLEGRSLSYTEVSERAARLAGHLASRGLPRRTRIALLALNEIETIEIRVGVQRAGMTLVPLNYRLSPSELQSILADSEPELLIVGPGLRAVAAELDVPAVLHLGDPRGEEPFPAGLGYDSALASSGALPLDGFLPAGEIGLISYTSGTTGDPKGVMLSNWAMHATMLAMGQEMAVGPGTVYLCSNPMFHVGTAVACAFLYAGGACLQMRRFQADAYLDLLREQSVTHGQLVPTMVHDLLERSASSTGINLRRLLYGAAPMPPSLVRRVIDEWRCELVNGYGSTEAMGVSMLGPEEHDPDSPRLLASVGRGSVGMASKVVDELDRELPPGEVGEIVARGANLMSGYWGRPDDTAEALRGGWMHTGDLGYRDEDGYLFLLDRRGDKIVSGGENVYPSEVEHVLVEHPAVADAAVVGVPHERWGEAVCAVVVRAGEVDEAGLVEFCRSRLAGYKVPKLIGFADSLPRNTAGKLLRRELRASSPGWAAGLAGRAAP